jgi:2-phosphosulfolactate phosphatase
LLDEGVVTRVDVALLPGQLHDLDGSVCVVVDVLRASSSVVTLLERGAEEVVAAKDIEEARRLKASLPGHLLCGEADGLPPDGFDYGNSPAEFSRLDLGGKSAILATSNGTRLIAGVSSAGAVMVGCLLNRTAVARAAVEIARERGLDITVYVSAAHGGTRFVLEDALGAAAIADAALGFAPDLEASDPALFARAAFQATEDRIAAAVGAAYHAKELAEMGLGADVEYCARLDVSGVAPLLTPGDGGELVLSDARRR